MATLELVKHTSFHCLVENEQRVRWCGSTRNDAIKTLPVIVWENGQPWREANLWAYEQLSARKNPKSVHSTMSAIHTYAKWLEAVGASWWDFPAREADRCLVRYRGALIEAMQCGSIASSTASQRIRSVVRFYRWLTAAGLLDPAWPMWRERSLGIRLSDSFGLERTLRVQSTDLNIPNRPRIGQRLEGGLVPVSAGDRDRIIALAKTEASAEMAWLLRLGFRTGMRIGTLTDLRVGTLDRAVLDPRTPNWYRIAIGPRAHPAVATKFSVTGTAWIERQDLYDLKIYAASPRRLKRQAIALPEDRDVLFLNRFGARYCSTNGNESRAINVEMSRLRRKGANKIPALRGFHFHQTRATFATELARAALVSGSVRDAICIVKDALLHRDESTTLRYIRFVEQCDVMSAASDSFSRSFLGVA